MTSKKIPIWKALGIAMMAYLLALVILSASVKSDDFWSMLFVTPRFRTGFIFYSMPFLLVGMVLSAVGRWMPSKTAFVIVRRVLIGLCVLALLFAIGLMNVFGSCFDFKLSI